VLELVDEFTKLEVKKVHNINLVTPGHYVPQIAEAISIKKDGGTEIPFVYNSNGYDSVKPLKTLEGLIDIYMPDLKYADDAYGLRYSDVPDYFTVSSEALKEMYRQVGGPVIENGIMKKGVLIRHLVIPGLTNDSLAVLDWIKLNVPLAIVNVMPQYRPCYKADEYPEINCLPTDHEYKSVINRLKDLGLQEV